MSQPTIPDYKAAKAEVRTERRETAVARRQLRRAEQALDRTRRKGADTAKAEQHVAACRAIWQRELAEDEAAIAERRRLKAATAPERRARCQEAMGRAWAGLGDVVELVAAVAGAGTVEERIAAGVSAVIEHASIPWGESERGAVEQLVGGLVRHADGAPPAPAKKTAAKKKGA